ncbi:MAG: hypothetical protein R2991_00430 [Thermoanaerobaculia bacterium]
MSRGGAAELSGAEAAAARLAAEHLAGGTAWLRAMAPGSELGSGEDLQGELAVRMGPADGARWTLVRGRRADSAVFRIEYPSGVEEVLTVDLEESEGAWRPTRLWSAVETRPPTERPDEEANGGPGDEESARAALLGLVALLGWGLTARSARRRVAAVAISGMALLVLWACERPRQEVGSMRPVAETEETLHLARLLPLRERLAAGAGGEEDPEELGWKGESGHVARIWWAQALLARDELNRAEEVLQGVTDRMSHPLVNLLEARIAVGRGDWVGAIPHYEDALELGLDTDVLRLELAQIYGLLDAADRAREELERAAALGSRLPEIYYALSAAHLVQEEPEKAEEAFRKAWRLLPTGRKSLFSNLLRATVVARPAVYPLLGLDAPEEPRLDVEEVGSRAAVWPETTEIRLFGSTLAAEIADATLVLPGAAELAPVGTVPDPAGADEDWEFQRALEWLEKEGRNGGMVGLGSPAVARRAVTAARALARRDEWAELLAFTEPIARDIGRAPQELVRLRASALYNSDREDEARQLLLRLYQRGTGEGLRDPGLLLDMAEAFREEGRYDVALKLLARANSILPLDSLRQRIGQVQMESDLAEQAARYESDHFEIVYPEFTGRRYAVELATVLEEERNRLARWIPPARGEPKIEVHLFPVESFLRNWGGDLGVVGLFDGAMKVPFADLKSLHPSLVAILSHELAHALIHQRTAGRAPHWLQEGLAQHIQMADQPSNLIPELTKSERYIAFGALEPILSGLSEAQFAEVAYSESVWAVHFLEARFGRKVFDRLLDQFAAGRTSEEALAACCRMEPVELDRSIQEWAASAAPAVWPTEERRYDREMRVAALRGEHPAAYDAPRMPTLGDRKALVLADPTTAVREWHALYQREVAAMKQALGEVYGQLHGGDGDGLGTSCARLREELDRLFGQARILDAPLPEARQSLTSALRNFRAAAVACEGGATATLQARITAAEGDLGDLARSLKPYGLRP